MSDRDDAIERLRRGTTPDGSGVAHWEDVDALLAAYDEAVEMQAKLEVDLDERDTDARRLQTRLAIAREALEEIDGAYSDNDEGYRALAQVAREALRRMEEADRE